ncbi:MAG: ABC transporter ATP-binding protein [Lachnospiraceae bacterium]|nr:ABC transporter ATP-binding protein [Lachnospiraceae bacterium]
MGEALLEIQNLSKTYAKKTIALDHVDLTVGRGRIVGLLGPNGSGKTTLIKIINGLLQPSEGTVLIDGSAPSVTTKSFISYLPERTYLSPELKIKDMFYMFADFYADFSMTAAEQMLQGLQIDPEAVIKSLSKGTREKVQLILVMSRQAKLYVLDEPIAGVDPAARDYILKTILNNYNPEASIILSTHLISDVENILDDIIFIKYGKIVLQSSVDNIRAIHNESVDAYFREVFSC